MQYCQNCTVNICFLNISGQKSSIWTMV